MKTDASPKVIVYGAGSIGCYIGGALLSAGVHCTLIGREKIHQQIKNHGLHLTDYQNRELRIKVPVPFFCKPENLKAADVIILTVKCGDLEPTAEYLSSRISKNTFVICLQNGVGAKKIAGRYLNPEKLLSGVVTFNVVNMGSGRFHSGNKGRLILESCPDFVRNLLEQAWIETHFSSDIESVLWGKLILNLNNCINALSGLPLLEELSHIGYRKILSESITELLVLLKQKGIKPKALNGIPPAFSALLMRLPYSLFLIIAGKMLKIDPLARSSMWEDLQNNRQTEIDYLNGAVVELAEELGRKAPVNERLIELIKKAENTSKKSPAFSSEQLSEYIHR